LLIYRLITYRGDHFRFGSIFIKKNNETEILKKKTETSSHRLVSVRFFRTKTGSNRFGLVFSVLARFFAGLARFFRFGFFRFRLIKPKPNRTGWFFQNFNRFFFMVRFFRFFFCFLGFSVFLLTSNCIYIIMNYFVRWNLKFCNSILIVIWFFLIWEDLVYIDCLIIFAS
jgi:hypothetical protein